MGVCDAALLRGGCCCGFLLFACLALFFYLTIGHAFRAGSFGARPQWCAFVAQGALLRLAFCAGPGGVVVAALGADECLGLALLFFWRCFWCLLPDLRHCRLV